MLAPVTDFSQYHRGRGVSLVEVLVGMAILGLLMALAVPSMKSFISKHKVSAISAELLADYYLARSESVQRGQNVGIIFTENANWTCYTIYTPESAGGNCDCTLAPTKACSKTISTELKTVRIPTTSRVTIRPTSTPVKTTDGTKILYTGKVVFLPPLGLPQIDTTSPSTKIVSSEGGQLLVITGVNGRQTMCTPDGSMAGVPAC
jgi:prepilin-type N-terminal cleavage/methylation domain-containing protein